MFLKISELECGWKVWYDWALKLIYPSPMPSLAPDSANALLTPSYWEAKLALDIVVEQMPRYADAYYHRGVAFAGMADYWASPMTGRALQDFSKALSLNPCFPEVYRSRAALFAKHDPVRAIADLSSLIAIRPTVEDFRQRAKLYAAVGECDSAVADYHEALVRYVSYCGTEESKVCEEYLERLRKELQSGNVQAVLSSLVLFWQQHALIRYL